MSTKNFELIPEEIIETINELDTIVYGVLKSEDDKLLIISTNFLDNRNDMIDVILWKVDDNVFLSDDFIVDNEYTTFIENENILNNINKLTNNFPITQYFYDGNIIGVNGKQLICKTNTTNLKLDLLYFCQSIMKHLDLIYCYNNLNLISQK